MAGAFDFLSEALNYAVQLMFDEFSLNVDDFWSNLEPALNNGQQNIYQSYIAPAIHAWMDFAGFEWPWVEIGEFQESIRASYQQEVMDRAFGSSLDKMQAYEDLVQKAQNVQELAYAAEALGL